MVDIRGLSVLGRNVRITENTWCLRVYVPTGEMDTARNFIYSPAMARTKSVLITGNGWRKKKKFFLIRPVCNPPLSPPLWPSPQLLPPFLEDLPGYIHGFFGAYQYLLDLEPHK